MIERGGNKVIVSAWHVSCTVLFIALLMSEVFFPTYFAGAPWVEVAVLAITSFYCVDVFVSRRAGLLAKTSHKDGKKRGPTTPINQVAPEIAAKQDIVMPVTPKQLTLPENTLTFERNVVGYLLQQLERTKFQHDDFTLQDIINLAHQPEHYLRLQLWPVVTFPQQKLLRYMTRSYIWFRDEYRLLSSLGGVADLLISLVTTHMVSRHVKEQPMMDFPVAALDYPKVVQHLFDCLNKKDSLLHKVLWLTNDLHNERHRLIWQRLKELGLTFAECVSFPQVNVISPYVHMAWDVFAKHYEIEKYRKVPISMQDFVSQSTHVILGDVPENAALAMSFDSVYGPFVGAPVILGGAEDARRLA